MRRAVLLLGLLTGAAVAQPVVLQTWPGGASAIEPETGQTVAQAADRTLQWDADVAEPHHYRLHLPPFNDVDLQLAWSPGLGRWWMETEGRRTLLGPGAALTFTRTVALNLEPPDTAVYAADPNGPQTLTVSGQSLRARPLARTAAGYTLPAVQPPTLYLVRHGFLITPLQLSEADLASPATTLPALPVRVAPAWGPFSYWQFDTALMGFTALSLGAWLGIFRPAARRRQALTVRRDAIFDQLPEELSGLSGLELRSEQAGSYVLVRLLGQGAMGAVYEAAPTEMDREEHVAVKVLLNPIRNEAVRARFRREIQVCCGLRHPNIAQVLDWGTFPLRGIECPFLVMELVPGQTLTKVMANVDEATMVAWLGDLLRALRVAHAAGIIHRDIKPDNIMVLPGGRLKLMDFGIARVVEESRLTKAGSALGTPQYMSPEHFSGEVVPASDLYSLGVVAYQCLGGRLPHDDDNMWGLMHKVVTEDARHLLEINPAVSETLGWFVMRLLARSPAERWPCAADALQALESIRFGRPSTAAGEFSEEGCPSASAEGNPRRKREVA